MAKLLVFFIVFQITNLNSLFSQSIKKAFRHYEKGEFVKLRETLEKLDEKSVENSGKYFMYTLLYLERKEERNILKTAHQNIIISKENYPTLDFKDLEELKELKIDIPRIDSVEDVIDSLEYQFVLNVNSIEEYIEYVINYPSSIFVGDAVSRRNSLEFSITSNQNTWQAYKIFMDSFPLANEYNRAKTLYDKLLFEERTEDKAISSYESFIVEYPDTPYRDSIEITLLKKYTVDNSEDGYIKFLSNFPKSKHSKIAANFLYHVTKRDFSKIKDLEIDKGLIDSLEKISSVDKLSLLGIYEEPVTNFINVIGDKILSNSSLVFDTEYMCSFNEKDIYVARDSIGKKILNRNFSEILSDNFSYVEDIGVGILKVFSSEGLSIIHKSGEIILQGNYDNAYLVNESYLLIEKNNRFSLFTVFGEKIFNNDFSDVYKEGPFIIFERDKDNKIAISNASQIKQMYLEGVDPPFIFEDYEYFDGDYMILINDFEESLVDENLREIIPVGNIKIDKVNYGWIYETEYGLKIITDLFKTDFSTYYESLSSNSKYVIIKSKGFWDVFSIDSMNFVLKGKDSVLVLSDESLWYRDSFTESILFSNNSEFNLPDNYDLKVMKPKYGSKTYIKVSSKSDTFILNDLGYALPSAEYYYTVESGNTISFLSQKFNTPQSELLKMNNKKNKNLFVGEKLKIKGYIPNDVVSDSLFLIDFNTKIGLSDINGEIVLEPIYDGITNLDKNNLILIKDEKFGNFNIPNRKLIDPNYSNIVSPFGESLYKVQEKNKISLINFSGEPVLSNLENIKYLNDTLSIISKNGISEIVSLKSKETIMELESYEIIDDSLGLIIVKKDDVYGLFSIESGILLKTAYDQINQIGNFDDRLIFKATQIINDARLLINIVLDSKGKIIINQGLDLSMRDELFCKENY